jgi:hypothetical protein
MRRSALNPKRTTTLYKLKNRAKCISGDSKFEKDFGLLAASGHDESAPAELDQHRKDQQEEGLSTATRKKSTKSMSFSGGRAHEPNETDEKMPPEEESPGLMHDQEEKVLKVSRFFPSPAEQERLDGAHIVSQVESLHAHTSNKQQQHRPGDQEVPVIDLRLAGIKDK